MLLNLTMLYTEDPKPGIHQQRSKEPAACLLSLSPLRIDWRGSHGVNCDQSRGNNECTWLQYVVHYHWLNALSISKHYNDSAHIS